MNIYKKKRLKTQLTQSDVANALGITINRYKAVESGLVKMPKDLIDKFYSIIDNDNATIEILNKKEYIEDWFGKLQENENGTYKNLDDLMNKFNIKSFKHLGILLGYSDGTLCCKYLHGKLETPYKFKNKLYNFFENEQNIQIPNDSEKTKEVKKPELTEVEKWFYSFDFNGFLKANGLTKNKVSRETGVSVSTLTKLQKGDFKYKTNLNSISKLYGYCTNFSLNTYEPEPVTDEKLIQELPNIPENDEKIIDYMEINRLTDDGIVIKTVVNGEIDIETDANTIQRIKDLIKKYEDTLESVNQDINHQQDLLTHLEREQCIYATMIGNLKYILGDNNDL